PPSLAFSCLFLFSGPSLTHNHTLSLHDDLPISEEFCRAPHTAATCFATHREARWASHLLEARKFASHWRAQNQQRRRPRPANLRSEEHTSELQSRSDLVCRLLLEKKK